MKKYAYLILTFLLLSCGASNNLVNEKHKEIIKSNFNQYLSLIINQEFEKSLNYISDDLFEIIPKHEMIDFLEKDFINSDMYYHITPEIINVNDVVSINNKNYSLLTYLLNTEIKVNESNSLEIELIRESFGEKNVVFNKATSTYQISSIKYAFATNNKNNRDWKFIVFEDQKTVLEKLIPDELVKQLLQEKIKQIRRDIKDDSIINLNNYKSKYPNFIIEHTELPILDIKTNLEKEAKNLELNSLTEIINNTDDSCGFIKLVGKGVNTLLRVKYIYLNDDSENGELAFKILNKYKNGESFSNLALQYGKDKNAEEGGDLGWTESKLLVQDFVKSIEEHKLNDVFVVKTKTFGWYVIQKTNNMKEYEYLEIIKVKSKENCRQHSV